MQVTGLASHLPPPAPGFSCAPYDENGLFQSASMQPLPSCFLLSLMTGMVGWSVSMCFNDEEKDSDWMQVTGSHLQPLLLQLGDGAIQYVSMDMVW